jgi:hypothetical protein
MIVDRATGVVRDAEIFVAVLGASNYTYAEATWTQKLADWIEAHVAQGTRRGTPPKKRNMGAAGSGASMIPIVERTHLDCDRLHRHAQGHAGFVIIGAGKLWS